MIFNYLDIPAQPTEMRSSTESQFCSFKYLDTYLLIEKWMDWLLKGNFILIGDFLQNFKNLESLDLKQMATELFSSIQPHLCELKFLKKLSLSGCFIKDFSFLSSLPLLENINLSETDIVDLSFLANSTSLHSLNLSSCGYLNDFSHFDLLPNSISNLNLKYCDEIQDFRFLEKLPNLEYLDLSSTKISNLNCLKKAEKIQSLKLKGLENLSIKDYEIISTLSNLKTLILGSHCNQDEFNLATQPLHHLEKIHIPPKISNFSSLFGKKIKKVAISILPNKLRSASDLESLHQMIQSPCLETLFITVHDFSSNKEINWSCITENLRELQIKAKEIDLRALPHLSLLRSLNLAEVERIKNLDHLCKISSIEQLHLFGSSHFSNTLEEISLIFSQLKNLQKLELALPFERFPISLSFISPNLKQLVLDFWVTKEEKLENFFFADLAKIASAVKTKIYAHEDKTYLQIAPLLAKGIPLQTDNPFLEIGLIKKLLDPNKLQQIVFLEND
ncbi:MAG: hypothetical protein L0207_00860 [Chlamydiae bacterium]|nr:hypothetical protein [Chlamydiota bacterium]